MLGHLGGIDEIGVFLVPAIAALLALRWVERRAKRSDSAARQDQLDGGPDGQQTGVDS